MIADLLHHVANEVTIRRGRPIPGPLVDDNVVHSLRPHGGHEFVGRPILKEEQGLVKGFPGAQNLIKSTDPAVVSRHKDFAGSIEALFKSETTDIKTKFESLKLDISRTGAQEEIIELLEDPSKIANLPPDTIDPKIIADVNRIIETIYFEIAGTPAGEQDDLQQTKAPEPSTTKVKATEVKAGIDYYPFVPLLKTGSNHNRFFFIRID